MVRAKTGAKYSPGAKAPTLQRLIIDHCSLFTDNAAMAEEDKKPWTVLALLNWTMEYFAKANLDGPRLTAEVLLAHVLSCQRIELYARFDSQPDQQALGTFRDLVRKAADNVPAAYLTGTKEFYSLELKVTPDVLIPRPETEILVAQAIDHLSSLPGPGRCWDVCTGSGCVAIAIAANQLDAALLATDISQSAIDVAQMNAEKHNLSDQIRFGTSDLLTLPDGCADLGPFDVITANPPYVATGDEVGPGVKHEPAEALYAGEQGLDMLKPIIRSAPEFLTSGGVLICEFGMGQADAVRDLMVEAGMSEPTIIRDMQSIERAAVAVTQP